MNKKEHLLTCLAEECSELQQAISKALRFGLDDGSPDKTTTNLQDIKQELIDIKSVVEMIQDEGIWERPGKIYEENRMAEKIAKVQKYMDYAKKRGTLI